MILVMIFAIISIIKPLLHPCKSKKIYMVAYILVKEPHGAKYYLPEQYTIKDMRPGVPDLPKQPILDTEETGNERNVALRLDPE